jgi:hypothetical protein
MWEFVGKRRDSVKVKVGEGERMLHVELFPNVFALICVNRLKTVFVFYTFPPISAKFDMVLEDLPGGETDA